MWAEQLDAARSFRVAVNQTVAHAGQALADGDEVAIFPPVTGAEHERRLYRRRAKLRALTLGAEMAQLAGLPDVGAQVCFVGQVRDFGDSQAVTALELEHYPGMTEKSLLAILDQARALAAGGGAGGAPGGLSAAGRSHCAGAHRQRPSRRRLCRLRIHHGLPQARRAVLEKEHTAAGITGWKPKHSDQQAAQRWQ